MSKHAIFQAVSVQKEGCLKYIVNVELAVTTYGGAGQRFSNAGFV